MNLPCAVTKQTEIDAAVSEVVAILAPDVGAQSIGGRRVERIGIYGWRPYKLAYTTSRAKTGRTPVAK